MTDFAAARKHMVDSQVRPNDVTDLRLQTALATVPREMFLPAEFKAQAYAEREIAYAPDRRMLVARDFAKLVALADPLPTDLVLDVACGSGYSTAILARLSETVVAIEESASLAEIAQGALTSVGVTNAAVLVAPITTGARRQGPFDLIFIGAAIEVEPVPLFEQLKDGGRLVALRRVDGVTRAILYVRKNGAISSRFGFDAASAFTLPAFRAARAFEF